MASLGTFLILAAFVTASGAFAASLAGARRGKRALIDGGVGLFHAVTAMTIMASAIMIHAFVTEDYSIKYVQHHADQAQPLFYKLASYWGGLDGSIMFWVMLLAVFGSVAVIINRERHRLLIPWVVVSIAVTEMFFLFLMVIHNNPFETFLTVSPTRGQGLNPLLQNFYMAIHPPMLYLGFTGMTIPFAFGIAALASGQLDDSWLRAVRALDDGRVAVPDGRPHARRVVGVRGAGLGRLLGLGSGRERRAAAVVHRHGVPALRDGAGAARHAEGLERVARDRHVLPDDLRHVHDALGRRPIGARVRRGPRARLALHEVHDRDAHGELRPGDLPPAAPARAQRARLLGVARGGIPREQLGAAVLGVLRALRHDVPDVERGAQRRAADRGRALLQQVDGAGRARAAVPHGRRSAARVAQVVAREPARSVPVADAWRRA